MQRFFVPATFTGFRRARENQYEGQALLKLEGVKERTATRWYLGKRVVFIHKSKRGFKVIIK